MTAITRTRTWIAGHRGELRQAARMTVAAVLALALGEALGMSRSYWAVLTALIVTQASLGGSIKATADRLVGTVSGALYGAVVAVLVPPAGPIGGVLSTALAVAPLALLAGLSAGFRIAPVTAIIVLVSPLGPHGGVLASAFDRVVEIGFGCLVGLACSLAVLPARASRLLAETAQAMAELLAQLLRLQITPPGGADPAQLEALQAQTRAALNRLESLVGEAQRERRTSLSAPLDPAPVHRTLLRLRHDLVMIGRAAAVPLPEGEIARRLLPPLAAVAEAAGEALRQVGAAFVGQAPAPTTLAAHGALTGYAAALAAVRAEGLTRPLPSDAVERLFALGFALDQLVRNLDDLAARAGEARG